MGNCIKKESHMQWGGEDWGPLASESEYSGNPIHERLFDQKGSSPFSSSSSSKTTTEVKIKITKKQLEELLGAVDVQALSVKQVLAQLMDSSDRFETHQRSWRPALQSIPEIN